MLRQTPPHLILCNRIGNASASFYDTFYSIPQFQKLWRLESHTDTGRGSHGDDGTGF